MAMNDNELSDQLSEMLQVLDKASRKRKFDRPGDKPQGVAALDKFEEAKVEETDLTKKLSKAVKDSFKSFLMLPKTVNSVLNDLEESVRDFSNDSIDAARKATLEFIKVNKLGSDSVRKFVSGNVRMIDSLKGYNDVISEQNDIFKKQEQLYNEKINKELEIQKSEEKIKELSKKNKTSQLKKEQEHLRQLKLARSKLESAIESISDEFESSMEPLAYSLVELHDSIDDFINSPLFDALSDVEKQTLKSVKVSQDITLEQVKLLEKVGVIVKDADRLIQHSSDAMVKHMKSLPQQYTAMLSKWTAIGASVANPLIESYLAQLSANITESTHNALVPLGMSAREQADIVSKYGVELAALTNQNTPQGAFESNEIGRIADAAKLFGLTGKEGLEFSLKNVSGIMSVGAADKGQMASMVEAMAAQLSMDAAYTRTGKAEYAAMFQEMMNNGSLLTLTNQLQEQGLQGKDLMMALMANTRETIKNTKEQGFSNEYYKNLQQQAMSERFPELRQMIMGKVSGEIVSNTAVSTGINLTEIEQNAIKKMEMGKDINLLDQAEKTAYFTASKKIAAEIDADRRRAISTLDPSPYGPSGVLMSMANFLGSFTLSQSNLNSALMAKQQAQSGQNLASVNTNGEMFSVFTNLDKAFVDSTATMAGFNNSLLVAEEKLLDLSVALEGVKKHPLGAITGQAVSGAMSLGGSALSIGAQGLGAYFGASKLTKMLPKLGKYGKAAGLLAGLATAGAGLYAMSGEDASATPVDNTGEGNVGGVPNIGSIPNSVDMLEAQFSIQSANLYINGANLISGQLPVDANTQFPQSMTPATQTKEVDPNKTRDNINGGLVLGTMLAPAVKTMYDKFTGAASSALPNVAKTTFWQKLAPSAIAKGALSAVTSAPLLKAGVGVGMSVNNSYNRGTEDYAKLMGIDYFGKNSKEWSFKNAMLGVEADDSDLTLLYKDMMIRTLGFFTEELPSATLSSFSYGITDAFGMDVDSKLQEINDAEAQKQQAATTEAFHKKFAESTGPGFGPKEMYDLFLSVKDVLEGIHKNTGVTADKAEKDQKKENEEGYWMSKETALAQMNAATQMVASNMVRASKTPVKK